MKISMLTLGCKVNQYEAECIASQLREAGHEVVESMQPADAYILSTCAVTNEAERKSRQMVAKLQKLNPKAKIIVCGCASQHNSKQFATKPNVTITLGTSGKHWIVDLLDEKGDYTMDPTTDYEDFGHPTVHHTRAFVKIQDGCDNYCSYCLIPYLRGHCRSRPLQDVVVECFDLSHKTKEIVLTGINLSAWGKDIGLSLSDVLSSLANLPTRIRLSSMEMNIVDKTLLSVMEKMPNLCEHFHLSVQSACNKTLKDMNRHYTIEEYMAVVEKLRHTFPTCAITTDLIVGYPTETEEDFEQTLKNVERIGFADMHLFPYSRREGTVASRLPMLDPEIVKDRVARITALRDKMKRNYLDKQRGLNYEVLLEEKVGNMWVGHARNFVKTYIDCTNHNVESNDIIIARVGDKYLDGVRADFVTKMED
ncbi:MAG: tRNA (N(6)-L-threonylcarbamoyladenosine(37)-C(2))-methylthiotransferase MtaB [Clostridia bacterium]|nr:tRNA (N(6)-L-threonylcarbamoyladenosine(37)-C(2))-methylthiotransferase MtaB [Clostridia bacterium]